jgi:hypothetical protein
MTKTVERFISKVFSFRKTNKDQFNYPKDLTEINKRIMPIIASSDPDDEEPEEYLRYLMEKYDLKDEIFGENE